MFFLFLLVLLVVFLLWFSFHVDKVFEIRNDAFINSVLVLIVVTILQCIMLLQPYYENNKFWGLLGKVNLLLSMFFMLNISFYCMCFPLFKKHGVVSFLKIIFMAGIVFVVFAKITDVSVSTAQGVVITSGMVAEGLSVSWHSLLQYVFLYGFPALSVLVMLINPENSRTKLSRQKMFMNILAVVVFEVTYLLFTFAARVLPMFSALYPVAYTMLLFGLYKTVRTNILFDMEYIWQKLAEMVVCYAVPGVLCGIGVAFLVHIRKDNPVFFICILLVFTVVLLFIAHYLSKYFSKRTSSFNASYEKQLEKDLASLDYDGGGDEVTGRLDMIFSSNVGTAGINILMNHGVNFETVYSTTNSSFNIPTNNTVFDSLLNMNRFVVFKNQLDSQYSLSLVKDKMNALFEETRSEVCILFVEGHRLLGMLLLNEKRLGNIYSDYDYSVFKKLYSYFFLVGYYLHSVANESVVGTVNREIKMSDQIIRSIQENMDFIKNPKVDVGYLMVPAHNIGGEFIDFIRLTDDRHIFILGAMSGKGITASMSMVILKSIIRTFLKETKDFKELVQKVNSFIRSSLPKGTFFAGVFALMDFKENVMYYINCGVPALLLYTQAYNNVIEIQGEGRVLGFARNIEKLLKVKKIKLSPGDVVFSCTEGLIESHSLRGETFGKDRIQKSVVENLSYPAEKIAQFTYQNLQAFTSRELEADITVVALKYLGNKAQQVMVEQSKEEPVADGQQD